MPTDPVEFRLTQLEDIDADSRLATVETQLREYRNEVTDLKAGVDGMRKWLQGIAGGILVALVLLVLELAAGFRISVSPH